MTQDKTRFKALLKKARLNSQEIIKNFKEKTPYRLEITRLKQIFASQHLW
ncbi:MAG: hypothetical protein ACUVQ6_01930 [Dissulfurimicrobium sp.]